MSESVDDSVQRVTYISHMQRRRSIKPGDHIYVWRGPYLFQHHGIYTGEEGDAAVIHVSGKTKNTAIVCSTSLSGFLQGGILRLVSYNDHRTNKKILGTSHTTPVPSLPADVVLQRAKEYLNDPESWGKYNLWKRNCEDFAYYCKTGHLQTTNNTLSN